MKSKIATFILLFTTFFLFECRIIFAESVPDALKRLGQEIEFLKRQISQIKIIKGDDKHFPLGTILPWDPVIRDSKGMDTRQRRAIPKGWKVCDGVNGTPDLRNLFLMGASSSADTGKKGGIETISNLKTEDHELTINQMPSHRHNITGNMDGHKGLDWGPGKVIVPTVSGHIQPQAKKYLNKWNSGKGKPHSHKIKDLENRPPYYSVLYIIKLE